ncbi:MAG: hypothetical protein BGO09_00535 [Bacteroidetes bacterium 47-18]|nr:MAG: hypothetical protein BGO09_00535 [Bacteroidetes bacterium 47-18]
MMTRILLLLIYMLATVHGYCFNNRTEDSLENVIFNEIEQVLHHKSFEKVRLLKNKYFNINLLNYEKNLHIINNYKFHSARIAIKKSLIQDHNYPGSFLVNIISKEDTIIYYTLSNTDLKTADSFYNTQAMSVLMEAYNNFYPGKLSLSEVIAGDIFIYGNDCGMSGALWPERIIIEEAIKTSDTSMLNQWLSSPYYEKKVYAYEALKRLENKGLTLSVSQSRVLRMLESCNEKIKICGGCIVDDQTVKYTIETMVPD